MAVALLLDESGSMCSCDRCTYARASAIILYDFCRSLRIPVMVYGTPRAVETLSYIPMRSSSPLTRMTSIVWWTLQPGQATGMVPRFGL